MKESLDNLATKLCEKMLPPPHTFFEDEGKCIRNNEDCSYSTKIGKDYYLCNKKTYILDDSTITV